MKDNYNLGNRVRDLRILKGFSQEQLALLADITPTYLGLIERNAKNPTLKVIQQICNALNLSLSDFFSNDTVEDNLIDPTISQIITLLTNRTPEEKKLLLQVTKEVLKLRDLPIIQEREK